ncbi:ABC-type transport auxiliary lipoprotein family protein [Methylacidimicrobium sp. B4]|uniref:ABC-type transport auxiliary lipoprotein family protein n=1 Tax=Methylacidimicrobium sp. B4 TaxID=2796139 RepID=UPI001A8FA54A|nr:ABC-type transport auxiliary lipoprotein family protein [Methylacidimicrobium sp. B4]QSR84411.1 membrane integrity-associated transporter subunit PqiC [Methylacidimicrobium sp. B4]
MNPRILATRRLFFLSLCLPFFGCMSRPARLPSESFSFAPSTGSSAKEGGSHLTLVVRSVRVVAAFAGEDFVYRASDYRYERDPYAHFLASPELLIRSAVSDILQSSGLFQAVVAGGSAVMTHSFAEISVRQLYGDFRPGRPPAAVIALRFLLVQSPGGIPLWEETIARRVPLRERSTSSLMAGWNAGIHQILAEAGPSLAKQIRAADEAARKALEKVEAAPVPKPPPPPTPAQTVPAEG